ncbi:type II secretion system F family protein [Glaesserella sp.]|uniref:type II secretion system F family protein n=1 Tax=Glaesserella sp. TaxID=2094731 RepID=UPI0035A17F03
MIKIALFLLALILSGSIFLFIAFSAKKKFDIHREIILNLRPKEKNNEDIEKGKTKQQIELELLLINNNPFLKLLGTIDKNVKAKLLTIFVVSLIYYLFNRNSDQMTFFIGIFVVILAVILIPGILTNSILKSKIKRIMTDLAGFIDLVAVNVQTGVTIEAALKQVAMDFKKLNPDLTYVLLRIIRKAEITGLSAALQDLAISLPTKEIRMFCTVMQQSLNFGSSIYPQLTQLSADIREMQLLVMEEKLGTLSAKMSIPLIIFIMFPIIILILAPGAMRVFPNVF